MAKRIFVAATRQNDGKTTVSLGLLACISGSMERLGFIKPVGQRYIEIEGHKIDEDAVLMRDVFGMSCNLSDMSPVAIARRFTRDYIEGGSRHELESRIWTAYRSVAAESDFVVIEGTGHAGVGSCFDLSNAAVARLLKVSVIIVTGGGIGRPIDEVMLNRCLFSQVGVDIMGVIINKVRPDKLEEVEFYARKGLQRLGLELLGVIPYREQLVGPTMGQVLEEIGGELINGADHLDVNIERTLIGAMTPHQALDHFGQGALLITGGDREDLILAAMGGCILGLGKANCVSGIVLTGGIYPHDNIMRLIRKTWVPVILVKQDSFNTARNISELTFKIRPGDKKKISVARRLVNRHVNVDRVLEIAMEQVVD
ncbi:MAG: phosphotransacetylase family protein [Planctomycetota bacterium]|jgi:BioD-like phosphotransacetylase family protein